MSDTKFTPQQKRAIDARTHDILVSASAGAGKTTVLVDRVIKMLKEDANLNIDQLLMVTFTNEAADNMRDRIRRRLEKEANNRHLRDQINRLAIAHISTIHAFCQQLIKRYYYLIDLDPQFRLLTDETETILLQDQVWDDLREELYARDALIEDPSQRPFEKLVLNFVNDRSDDALSDIVMELDRVANAQADPHAWLKQLPKMYELADGELTKSSFYQKQLLPVLKRELTQIHADFLTLTHQAQSAGLDTTASMLTADTQTAAELLQLIESDTWDAISAKLNKKQFPTIKGRPKKDELEAMAAYESIKDARNDLKDRIQSLHDHYFMDASLLIKLSAGAKGIVDELVDVVWQYRQNYQQLKLQRHLLDFSDLEHYAYQILTVDTKAGKQTLKNLQRHFKEIMIDEYQDTNPLQEKILQQLHDPSVNRLFMVGDVKQSIYRFRQADPTMFLHKYQTFVKEDQLQPNSPGELINLAENFRSMPNVTDFTNLLFSQLMDHQVGEMDYDEAAHLKFAAQWYPEDQVKPVEVMLYDANAEDNDEQASHEADRQSGELRMVGMRIRQMLDNHEQIFDPDAPNGHRDIKPGDIVLLERAKSINNTLVNEFASLNIPLTVHGVENYFKSTEVRTIVSLLKIIDNPYQDIPLVAVLRSPIVNLTEPEMAFLRINDRHDQYFGALKRFVATYHDLKLLDDHPYGIDLAALYQKTAHFLKQLHEFHETAQRRSLVELIWQIYQETGYLDYVAGMPGGQQRSANLHALYERAHGYEESSFKGLYQFIRFIERMQKRNQDLGEAPAQLASDTVNVMTIHGAKGLEFPVVFLIDTAHGFKDENGKAIIDANAGLGIKYLGRAADQNPDALPQILYDLPQRNLIIEAQKASSRAEDLRVLYVALTRAQQRLIITGSVNENKEGNTRSGLAQAAKTWQKALQSDQAVIGAQARLNAHSFLDWIGMGIMRAADFDLTDLDMESDGDEAKWQTSIGDFKAQRYNQTQLQQQLEHLATQRGTRAEETATATAELTPKQQQLYRQVVEMKYPHPQAIVTTAYQAVSDIKQLFATQDPDDREMGRLTFDQQQVKTSGWYRSDDFAQPEFMTTQQHQLSATEIGTATHLVFQKLDLTGGVVDEKLVKQTIAQLRMDQLLSSDELAAAIDVEGIVAFYQTELGQRILTHVDSLHREAPFSMLINAAQLFKNLATEKEDAPVLVHGIIDGYFISGDGLELFDYKTDHVDLSTVPLKERFEQRIVDRYSGQLNLYAGALQAVERQKVAHRWLYLVAAREIKEI
ncbi:helicase-exonuclease AddAB subunit AddA [Limosilactobacillus mucosae]